MIRSLPLLGRAAQEAAAPAVAAVTAVALLQTQLTSQPPPVASRVPQAQVAKQVPPPVLSSSRPAVHLRVRRMRAHLPPGFVILLDCLHPKVLHEPF